MAENITTNGAEQLYYALNTKMLEMAKMLNSNSLERINLDDPKDKLASRPVYKFSGRACKRGEAVTLRTTGNSLPYTSEVQACLQ